MTDDTVAIKAAIDSVSSGGTVTFPAGTYVINSGNSIGVDVNGFTNLSIVGEGDVVILNPDAATENRPFVLRNGTGLLVENLHFKCLESSTRTTNGLDVQNVNSATIRGNKFTGQTFYGLGVFQDTIAPLNGTCNDLIVENNLFEDVQLIGAEIFPKVVSNLQIIRGNTFKRCGTLANGTAFKCAQGYTVADIYDNTIVECGASGLATFATSIGLWDACTFRDNLIVDSQRASIAITVQAHPLFSDQKYNSLQITGNTIISTNAYTIGTDSAITLAVSDSTIYTTNSGTIEISGNVIKDKHRGFECRPTTDPLPPYAPQDIPGVSILDNSFENIDDITIYTDDANTGVMISPTISGNTFISNDPTKTSADLQLRAVAGSTVSDNVFIRSAEYAIKYIAPTTGEHNISGNSFIDGHVVGGSTRGAILSSDSTAVTYNITGNSVVGGNWAALYLGFNATPTVNFRNNVAPKLTTNSTPTRTVNSILGESTSTGDVAVNGYVTVTSPDGAVVKIDTVA